MENSENICRSNPNFSFLIGDESPYSFSTNDFFFHSKEFLNEQFVVSFYILNNKKHLCAGIFNVSIRGNAGYSPLKAPFGSIDINRNLPPLILNEFLEIILHWCNEKGLAALVIKHYPQCYDPAGSVLIQNALFSKGFETIASDIAQYIDVLSDLTVFNRSARIKINKCKKVGFQFRKLDNSCVKEVYRLIKGCKDRKGYPMNMSLHEIENVVNRFPERYQIFGVTDNDKLICASICVVVNTKILYDFAHGHLWEYDRFSPVNLLVEGILNHCLEKEYKILDLGLSTYESRINNGLFDFKSRLGTLPSAKLSYTKNLF